MNNATKMRFTLDQTLHQLTGELFTGQPPRENEVFEDVYLISVLPHAPLGDTEDGIEIVEYQGKKYAFTPLEDQKEVSLVQEGDLLFRGASIVRMKRQA